MNTHSSGVENTSLNVDSFEEFCQFLSLITGKAFSNNVSLRLVAEKKSLKEKLEQKSLSEKLSIIKLQPSSISEVSERFRLACAYNKKGYAVFYLPQEYAPGYSETYDDIKQYRALVVDLDGAPLSKVYEIQSVLRPSAIIESSAGKFQVIYRIDEREQPKSVDEFNEVAASLGAFLDADLNAARATQAFRCPGFMHWKSSEGFKSRIVSSSDETCKNSWHEFLHFLDSKSKEIKKSLKERRDSNNGGYKKADVTGLFVQEIDLEALMQGEVKVGSGERHNTILRLQTRLLHSGKKEGEVTEIVDKVIASSFIEGKAFLKGGLRRKEVETSLSCALAYVQRNKEREEAYKTVEPFKTLYENKEEGQNNGQKKDRNQLNSGFDYDFRIGTLAADRYTESAVGDRLAQRFRDDIAKCENRNFCFNRGDSFWRVQTHMAYAEIKARVEFCIKEMFQEEGYIAQFINSKGVLNEKALAQSKKQFLKASTVANICKGVMNSTAILRYSRDEFDAAEHKILCNDGLLDMLSGEIRPATNKDLCIFKTPISWNQGKTPCVEWKEFLAQVFEHNQAPEKMINFIQEVFGYSLSGSIGEEKIFCHLGGGANGKSKVLYALRLIAGDYATVLEPDELVSPKRGFGVRFERVGAKIEARRIAIVDDLDVAGVWNEGFVKTLTGEVIRCRAEYEQSRTSRNRCKFHLGLNVAPEPEAENLGLLRRLCIIPYNRTFTPSYEKEKSLRAMMLKESSGILTWSIEGLRRVITQGGIEYPAETHAAVSEYRREHFHTETAIEELFERPESEGDGEWVSLAELTAETNAHFDAEGRFGSRLSPDMLGKALSQRMGFRKEKRYDKTVKNTVSFYLIKRK